PPLLQWNAHRGLLLIAQDCDTRMPSAASLPGVAQEVLGVPYRSVVELENHIARHQAGLGGWAVLLRFLHCHTSLAWGSSSRDFVQSHNVPYSGAFPYHYGRAAC